MAESARTKSGSAISAPRAGTARDRTWRLRPEEAGRLVSGTAPIVDQGSAPKHQRLGGPRAVPRREERVAATAERPRVGSGAGSEHGGRLSGEILTTRLRMRLRMRLPGWIVDVTEAMHRRDCPGGSHNYSNPGKVLEG